MAKYWPVSFRNMK